jgi:1-acyl-sn-glycerol-3-phosphate acyltransferase
MLALMLTANAALTPAYRAVMALTSPVITRWGRLDVSGLEHVPLSGPTLIICNHDSYWDPIAVGVAARRRRQIRALAKSSLWNNRFVGWVLDGMGQIPIQRGQNDTAALDAAITELRGGACIGVFPEGTSSRGRIMRARSGAGRLAEAVPGTVIVCAAIRGTVDVIRAPKRPRIQIEFYIPDEPTPHPGETPGDFMVRLMIDVRSRAPIAVSGRARTAALHRRKAAASATSDGDR